MRTRRGSPANDISRLLSNRSRTVGAVTISLALVLSLAGCPTPIDWDEYDGVNFIAGRGFGSGSVWQESDDGNGGDYLTFEQATDDNHYPSDAPGTPFRLELINLIPDGDFETATAGSLPDAWQATTNANARVVTAEDYKTSGDYEGVELAAFHGNKVLKVDFVGNTERLYLNMATEGNLTVREAFEKDASFAFFLDFRTPYERIPVSLNSDGALETDAPNQYLVQRGQSNKSTVSYRFPGIAQNNPAQYEPEANTFTVFDPAFNRFSLGGDTEATEQRVEGVIDNVRLVRADLTHEITLDVPLQDSLQPDRPRLLSRGTYEFSFWVARDLSQQSNRFDARYVTVSITDAANETGSSLLSEFVSLEELNGWGDGVADVGWTKLSYQFSGPSIPFGTGGSDAVMTVHIAFGNGAKSDHLYPGSLMVAAPRLQLITP
ncbi:MAG: hypothetical protein WD492_10300 [Alkalispirochaeta sp.]